MTAPARRKKTARFIEIAAAAGVSVATVDRVLNERGSVSAQARDRVVAAARELAVPRLLPDTRHGLIHIDILLPDNRSPFFQRLRQALQQALPMLDQRVVVHQQTLGEKDEAGLLRALRPRPYLRQGLIVAAPDTPAVQLALQAAIQRGEQVVLVVSNVAGLPQARYVGIDNHAAGRTAGLLLGRLCRQRGRGLLLSSRPDYRGHLERASGCAEVLVQDFPHLQCDQVATATHDDADRCHAAVSLAFKQGQPIAGIYNSGAGSPGIEAALRRYAIHDKVCWVTHELSDDHRLYLQQGLLDVVIDQDPDGQAIKALQHVLSVPEQAPAAARAGPAEFRLYLAENMLAQPYLTG